MDELKKEKSKLEKQKEIGICLFMVLAYFMFAAPIYVLQQPLFDRYDFYIRAAVVFVLLAAYLREVLRTRRIDPLLIAYNLYAGILIIATLRSGGALATALWQRWLIADAFILLFYFSMQQDRQKIFLRIVFWTLAILILWDAKTTLVPKELWADDFSNIVFRNYNNKLPFYLPAIMIGYLIWEESGHDKTAWKSRAFLLFYIGLQVLMVVTVVYCHAVTTTMILCVFLLYLWLCAGSRMMQKFYSASATLFSLLFFYLEVWKAYSLGFIGRLTALVGKNATFSGRTPIWQVTSEFVRQKPLLGYGVMEPAARKSLLLDVYVSSYAHNMYLNTLFEAGIFGLMTKVAVMLLAVRRAWKVENIRIRSCLIGGFVSYLAAAQFEDYSETVFLTLIALMYYYRGFSVKVTALENTGESEKLDIKERKSV